jgi:hypothetical protein
MQAAILSPREGVPPPSLRMAPKTIQSADCPAKTSASQIAGHFDGASAQTVQAMKTAKPTLTLISRCLASAIRA